MKKEKCFLFLFKSSFISIFSLALQRLFQASQDSMANAQDHLRSIKIMGEQNK